MKQIHKAEDRLSEIPLYLYIMGAAMKLAELIKIGCKSVIRHFIELLMLSAAIGMITFVQLMDKDVISFNVAMLLVIVLGAFIIGLIKIKIKRGE